MTNSVDITGQSVVPNKQNMLEHKWRNLKTVVSGYSVIPPPLYFFDTEHESQYECTCLCHYQLSCNASYFTAVVVKHFVYLIFSGLL